jgi:hypothetical protein
MGRYQLCVEDRRAENPWAAWDHCWHVIRVGAEFALCSKALKSATSVRPLQDAACIPHDERCPECWTQAFGAVMLPT